MAGCGKMYEAQDEESGGEGELHSADFCENERTGESEKIKITRNKSFL